MYIVSRSAFVVKYVDFRHMHGIRNKKEGGLLFNVSAVVFPKFPAAHPTRRISQRESEFISHMLGFMQG